MEVPELPAPSQTGLALLPLLSMTTQRPGNHTCQKRRQRRCGDPGQASSAMPKLPGLLFTDPVLINSRKQFNYTSCTRTTLHPRKSRWRRVCAFQTLRLL
jgi:hypothetical protein